jgi:hypothetical protein
MEHTHTIRGEASESESESDPHRPRFAVNESLQHNDSRFRLAVNLKSRTLFQLLINKFVDEVDS